MCIFFFNDTATTEIYTLSLHDALPICAEERLHGAVASFLLRLDGQRRERHLLGQGAAQRSRHVRHHVVAGRSEEHTSELQSRQYLVCRLLLEKKKNTLLIPLTSIHINK